MEAPLPNTPALAAPRRVGDGVGVDGGVGGVVVGLKERVSEGRARERATLTWG